MDLHTLIACCLLLAACLLIKVFGKKGDWHFLMCLLFLMVLSALGSELHEILQELRAILEVLQ